jgi:hypothetical protein
MSADLQIAQTVLQQLGGAGKLRAMIGASGFVAIENGVQFSFKGCRAVNKVVIILTPWDLYDITFYKYSPSKFTCKPSAPIVQVSCDQLQRVFEGATGLYLSL